ncbi:MAG: TonB-dependent receptor [Acidobacteriota bacterium]|nr:TonB-dependent receptor [Acidobacteriota bacterium]
MRAFSLTAMVFVIALSGFPAGFTALAAQSSAMISGRVVDLTGAVVPGAALTARYSSGVVAAVATSDAGGRFVLRVPGPGHYDVAAVLDGFSLAQARVTVDEAPVQVELLLRPGGLAEELTVIGVSLAGSEEMRRRLPGGLDLLTREVMDAAHVFSTSEALRKVPGVSVRDEEGLGLRPNIGIRGLNPTRSAKVLLLEDGLPVSYAPYGDNASYYHPPIERFDRVEVLKGSSQIAYGPVTLGGVVNYITSAPPARPRTAIQFAAGSRDYLNANGSLGGTWRRTGVFAHALRKQSDGARDNVRSELTDVMAKVHRSYGMTSQLAVKGNYYRERSQVTYSGLRDDEYRRAPRGNPFANDHFDGDRAGASLVYRGLLWSRVALTGSAYASSFARDWWRQSSNSGQRPNDAADPRCAGMANLATTCGNEGRLRRYQQGGVELRARHDFVAGVRHEIDAGVRVHREQQDRRQENGDTPTARSGVLVEDNLRGTDALSAFVQHRWLAGSWTVTPGARVERISYSRTNVLLGASGRTSTTEFVPGVGVSWGPTADRTLFAGLHRGFAPARAEDIINNTGGTVELQPERSWNYEAGGRLRAGVVSVQGTAFRLDYSNQVVPASLAGGVGSALTNGGQTLHQGVEGGVDADWREVRGTRHDLYARVSYTWLPIARFEGVRTSNVPGFSGISVTGNRLPYAPVTTASITTGYRHALGLDVQLEAQHVADQFADDLNTVVGSPDGQRGLIPAHTYLNLAVSWHLPRRGASVFLAVKNLDDRLFIVDRSRGILPGHPRLVQVGTSWRF